MGKFLSGRLVALLFLVFCVTLEIVALYYQYQLEYYPCVMCIHARIIIALVIAALILQLLGYKFVWLRMSSRLVVVALCTWMVERGWQLLATERGWNIGDCNMELGFPTWLAFDQWFPWMFKIHEPCGYTPYVLAEITMAEILLVTWSLILLTQLWALVYEFAGKQQTSD
ncbi:MAG: disulfide bond formation protein DsbB [Parasphingorhabdus sp.]|jgi:disulfide bond formation protein DsbB